MRDPKPLKELGKIQRNSRTFSRYFHKEIRRKKGRELQNRKNIVQGIEFQDSDRAANESLIKKGKGWVLLLHKHRKKTRPVAIEAQEMWFGRGEEDPSFGTLL